MEKTSDKKQIGNIDLWRDDEGLIIKLVFPYIENIIKQWSKGAIYNPYEEGDMHPEIPIIGYKAYKLGNVTKLPIFPSGINPIGTFANGLIIGNAFNIKYLTFAGISEGITLKVLQPFSTEGIRNLYDKINSTVSEFIAEFSKPVKASLTFFVKDLEVSTEKKVPPPIKGGPF